MDDLLLFTPTKKSHMAKLEDLLKVLLKMDSKYPQRNTNFLKDSCSTLETLYSLKIGVGVKLLQRRLEAT